MDERSDRLFHDVQPIPLDIPHSCGGYYHGDCCWCQLCRQIHQPIQGDLVSELRLAIHVQVLHLGVTGIRADYDRCLCRRIHQ